MGASGRPGDRFGDGTPEVAFAGRSNVGKSSLLNQLVGSKVARTSSTPGRTRTINWFRVEGGFWLVDLPGYGYAKASREARAVWAKLVAGYFEARVSRRLVVQLVDSKVGATDLDVEAARYFDQLAVPKIVAATKIDRLRRNDRGRSLESIGRALSIDSEADLLAVSAVTGEGVRELWKRISEFLAR